MTAASVAKRFSVNVMKMGHGKRSKWHAFRGGNGTGESVVNVASAYTLQGLATYLSKKRSPLIEVLNDPKE